MSYVAKEQNVLSYWRTIIEDSQIPDFKEFEGRKSAVFKKQYTSGLLDIQKTINKPSDIYEILISEEQDDFTDDDIRLKMLMEPVQYLYISLYNFKSVNDDEIVHCGGFVCKLVMRLDNIRNRETSDKKSYGLIKMSEYTNASDGSYKNGLSYDFKTVVRFNNEEYEILACDAPLKDVRTLDTSKNDEGCFYFKHKDYPFGSKEGDSGNNYAVSPLKPFIPRDMLFPQRKSPVRDQIRLRFKNGIEVDVGAIKKQQKQYNDSHVSLYDTICQADDFFDSIEVPDGYVEDDNIYILPVSKKDVQDNSGMSRQLLDAYDESIKNQNNISAIGWNYINAKSLQHVFNDKDPLVLLNSLDNYRGSMNCIYGLSESQTDAISAYSQMPSSNILAVNGPPGTGKTTLLQSVIASEVVKSVLSQSDKPAMILGVSATNQAVTNINNGMSELIIDNETDVRTESLREKNPWIERWVSNIQSYGLYVPGGPRLHEAKSKKYQIAKYNMKSKKFYRIGGTKNYPDYSFINNLSTKNSYIKFWLTKAQSVYPDIKSIDEGLGKLAHDIQALQRRITQIKQVYLDILNDINKSLKTYVKDTVNYNVESHLKVFNEDLKETEHDMGILNQASDLLMNHNGFLAFFIKSREKKLWNDLLMLLKSRYNQETPLPEDRKISSWLSYVRDEKERLQQNRQTLTKYGLRRKFLNKDNKMVYEKEFSSRNIMEKVSKKDNLNLLYSLLKDCDISSDSSFIESFRTREWGNVSEDVEILNQFLDTNTRFELFQKASRYWEGKWIKEYRDSHNGFSLEHICMIMPCIISTIHKAPSFMNYSEPSMKESEPRFDLVVIDEAGQASPCLGYPVINMSKKAMIVGDIYQLEPVATLSKYVDAGICDKYDLNLYNKDCNSSDPRSVAEANEKEPFGSIMRIAQDTSYYILPGQQDTMEKGMFLKDHRRCSKQIIAICNELIYNGRLVPHTKEGSPVQHDTGLLNVLEFIPCDGEMQRYFGSQRNICEAETLVDYVMSHWTSWLNIFDRDNDEYKGNYSEEYIVDLIKGQNAEGISHVTDRLKKMLSIVTPFKAQTILISSLLRKRWNYILDKYNVSEDDRHNAKIFSDVRIGTVHVMQGAESFIVIMSTVYDSTNELAYMLNNKPNLLNVAVSRAKKHFIVIGHDAQFKPEGSNYTNIVARHLL